MFDEVSRRLSGLRRRYAEPHRAYHTQAHVDAMLVDLRGLGAAVTHIAAVELAIWYHDAIYDPAATDNEARSAALLRAELDGLADPAMLSQAETLIRGTASHSLPTGLPAELYGDMALFLDLDMAVLGADPAAFLDYERGIAAEYIPVHGSHRFRIGRAGFIRDVLDRPRLFQTDRFHLRYDAAARRNLRNALASLGG